jgi:ATP-dependent Lon protease
MGPESANGEVLPLVPLRNMVLFPGVVTNLRIGRPRSLAAVEKALQEGGRLVLTAQRRAEVEEASPDDLYDVGVTAEVRAAPGESPGGARIVIAAAIERCRIAEFVQLAPYIAVTRPQNSSNLRIEPAMRSASATGRTGSTKAFASDQAPCRLSTARTS